MKINGNRVVYAFALTLLAAACSEPSAPASDASATLSATPSAAPSSNATCLSADLVIHNTTIYTVNDAQWTAEAAAALDGRIVFVGSNADAQAYMCGEAEILDMAGNTVYAGFADSHQHLEGVGRRTKTLSLFGIPTLQGTVERIEEWAATIPEGEWIQGRGWIEREWTDEQRFLNKADVDAFTQNKPLYMPRADGVSALVNSRALEMAGVTRDTPDPEGGRFERDIDGNPTGYVLANAMNVFRNILPPETDEYLKDNLLRGLQANAAMGWTQTHDLGMSLRLVDLMKELHTEGQMSHRVYAAVPIAEANEFIRRGREQTADDMFVARGIKVYIDGTLGSRGAALIENYSDADHNGFMNRTTKEELVPVLHASLQQGFQIMTHVIGDRAVRTLLDWYEEAWNAIPQDQWISSDLRWRMEHAQIIPPSDQQRFVTMNVLPSMQPSHGIGDLNFAPDRLGADRLGYAYPWQQLVDRGLMILGGSDAPVEVGDPRIEFYAAIERKRLDGTDGAGWHPELAVSRESALKMFTLWAAHGSFQENVRGSVEVGKYADFSIFNRDFMTVSPQEILTAENVMTIVGGEITYRR